MTIHFILNPSVNCTRLFLFYFDLQNFLSHHGTVKVMTLSMMWIFPGLILLGAMLFGLINLWIKKRREAKNPDLYGYRIRPDDFTEDDEKKF